MAYYYVDLLRAYPQQIQLGPDYLWIDESVIPLPSQQLASRAFWSLKSWNYCWHSSAPYWSLVEACGHMLMDMTFGFFGHVSVSPVLASLMDHCSDFMDKYSGII